MNAETVNPEAELAIVDALLAGSDQPPEQVEEDEDLMAPEPKKVETVKDAPEGVADEIDLLADPDPSPAPKVKERKDRVSAFADRIAEDRAKALLGPSFPIIVSGMGAAPKKVADKVYNVLCHVADRGKLSAYTVLGLQAVRDNPEGVNASMLIERFTAAGYSEATARSQAHQQMSALPILGLVTKTDHALKMGGSPLWGLLDSKAGAAPSPAPAASDEELLAAADDVPGEPDTVSYGAVEDVSNDEDLLAGD